MYENWTRDDLFNAYSAFSYLVKRLTDVVSPKAIKVILNDELTNGINVSYKATCNHFGVDYISLWEIDKIDGHPGILGMKQIALQVLENL